MADRENGNGSINDLLDGIQQISESDVVRAIKEKEAEMSVVKAELGRLRELQKIVQTKTAKKPRKKRIKAQPQEVVEEQPSDPVDDVENVENVEYDAA